MTSRAARGVAAGVLLAIAAAGMAGALIWRRAAGRAALARIVALTRDAQAYPERMRREQVELRAERDRLKRTLDSQEADKLVQRDLRASAEWAEIERERAAQETQRGERDELKQAHDARYRITRLEWDIDQLHGELAQLGGAPPPRPPGEDR